MPPFDALAYAKSSVDIALPEHLEAAITFITDPFSVGLNLIKL